MKIIIMIFSVTSFMFSYGQHHISYFSKLGDRHFEIIQNKYYFEYNENKEAEIRKIVKNFVFISKGKGLGVISEVKQNDMLFEKIFPILLSNDKTEQVVTDKILVKSKENVRIQDIIEKWKIKKIEKNKFDSDLYLIQLQDKNIVDILNLISNLNKIKYIEYVEPNFIYLLEPSTDDEFFYNQWALKGIAPEGTFSIKAEGAWNVSTGSGVKIAVLDEGVELEHPDLENNLLAGYDVFGVTSGAPASGDSHGTKCAGIISAEANNGIGVAGVAYDSNMIPVRIAYSFFNEVLQKKNLVY